MAQGLDYSYSHPDERCAANAGYVFVARYVGNGTGAKYLTSSEKNQVRAVGQSLVVVRETTAGFMIGGDGAAHARVSRAHCNSLGLLGIPIYYGLDVDPRGLNSSQRQAVERFLAGAADADGGGHNVGIYGSDDALDWFMGPNCRWGWQTYAWSSGRITRNAHFRQYRNGVNLCGGTVDLNETYATDFGQWPRPDNPIPVPVTEEYDYMWIFTSEWTGQVLVDGGEWTWIDQPAEVENLLRQNIPIKVFITESNARRFLEQRGANTDELIKAQVDAIALYTAGLHTQIFALKDLNMEQLARLNDLNVLSSQQLVELRLLAGDMPV